MNYMKDDNFRYYLINNSSNVKDIDLLNEKFIQEMDNSFAPIDYKGRWYSFGELLKEDDKIHDIMFESWLNKHYQSLLATKFIELKHLPIEHEEYLKHEKNR